MQAVLFTALLLQGMAHGADERLPAPLEQPIPSYLFEPTYDMWDLHHGKPEAYVPQPGDIMLATDKNIFWTITHDMAFAGEPHGSGIVVALPDGHLGILEAGPNDTLWVGISDMLPHLKEYDDKGPVWIRKRRSPLTEEQSNCLTTFALRQKGKRFALIRLGAQLTPLRHRGPLRTYIMGKPNGDRCSYFCSELVTESLVAGGLMDRDIARPSATYPHDLFFDQSYNLYISRHYRLQDNWFPPARWTYKP
jgi:hypothetical protein